MIERIVGLVWNVAIVGGVLLWIWVGDVRWLWTSVVLVGVLALVHVLTHLSPKE